MMTSPMRFTPDGLVAAAAALITLVLPARPGATTAEPDAAPAAAVRFRFAAHRAERPPPDPDGAQDRGPSEPRGRARSGWNAELAAHLLSRAGFGGTPEQVEYLTGLGRSAAVDYLVDYQGIAFEAERPAAAALPPARPAALKDLDAEDRRRALEESLRMNRVGVQELRGWWIERMVASPRPLEEKMTLFWHGHFTSGAREVKSAAALYRQNELLRRMAVGNFRELLVEVSRDPAMLMYLNNAQNRKRQPNENYARELMELFTLGVGHYTEQDVKGAARAFTGWSLDRESGGFRFYPRLHDSGVKSFLGHRGNFDGADVIDIILLQPAAADFLVGKLWSFFAGGDAPKAERQRLAALFRKSGYELKPVLKVMFRSDAFYADGVRCARVKGPVELIVGTLRMLDVPLGDGLAAAAAARAMGQDLFQPPNVKGWDGGPDWITTATLFNRYNLLAGVVYGTPRRSSRAMRRMIEGPTPRGATDERGEIADDAARGDDREGRAADPEWAMQAAFDIEELSANQPPYDPAPVLRANKLTTPEQVVDHYVARLLGRAIEPGRRLILIDEFKRVCGDSAVDGPRGMDATRGVIHLILSMPEYQLG